MLSLVTLEILDKHQSKICHLDLNHSSQYFPAMDYHPCSVAVETNSKNTHHYYHSVANRNQPWYGHSHDNPLDLS